MTACEGPVLVILDSDHRKTHVLTELRRYGPIVTKNSYLIVEDTNLNGHPIDPDFGPGPAEAVEEYLTGDSGFTVDRSKERHYLSFNTGGYLKEDPLRTLGSNGSTAPAPAIELYGRPKRL